MKTYYGIERLGKDFPILLYGTKKQAKENLLPGEKIIRIKMRIFKSPKN